MITPAQSHMRRHQALASGQAMSRTHADGYDLMLVKLATDRRRLKAIQSIERKIEVKREILPEYHPWISGILAANSARQDDVFMTVLLWTLDTGNLAEAYPMSEHALKHNWVTPDQYQRQTACMIAEEVADTVLKQINSDSFEELESLLAFGTLLEGRDMPDQVRARLAKATGLAQEKDNPEQALEYFRRALQLDKNSGVRKLTEQLERKIRNAASVA